MLAIKKYIFLYIGSRYNKLVNCKSYKLTFLKLYYGVIVLLFFDDVNIKTNV